MINLLSHPLVRKYFGCFKREGELHEHNYVDECDAQRALHILQSMQEPLKKGDEVLAFTQSGWKEHTISVDFDFPMDWHPWFLRLPSRFQEQAKKECHVCRAICECGKIMLVPNNIPKDSWATGDPVNEKTECPFCAEKDQWIASLKSQLVQCSSENALVHAENLNLEKKANQTKA